MYDLPPPLETMREPPARHDGLGAERVDEGLLYRSEAFAEDLFEELVPAPEPLPSRSARATR